MKKRLLAALATGLLVVGMGGVAQALPLVSWSEVGSPDTLVAIAKLANSSDLGEVTWANTALGLSGASAFTEADLTKTENKEADWVNWFSVASSTSGAYAFKFLTDEPAYFFIKVGVGTNDPQYSHLLFQNIEDLEYGVVTLAQHLGTVNFEIKNFGKFSHIAELGSTPVPEPATMLLFGTGLAGLAAVARRRKN